MSATVKRPHEGFCFYVRYSCTAFAYGQTGSGKTYTITGPLVTEQPPIICSNDNAKCSKRVIKGVFVLFCLLFCFKSRSL